MNLRIDSREVNQGDMFFCIVGAETDGHKYVDNAIDNGALYIIYQNDLPTQKRDGVIYFRVEDTKKALNHAADSFYGHPSQKLTMFGITGTNGKTTIASIISQVYSLYKKCGYIGTINACLGDKVFESKLTTPEPITLHRILGEMKAESAEAVAMEVSSHGLSQGRVDSVDFDCAIFTNLTQDHLNFYKTMENYFEAKKILFKRLKPDGVAVLNRDSKTYNALKKCCKAKVVTYGIDKEADYVAKAICHLELSTSFILVHRGKEYKILTNLEAEYNIYNLLASVAAMHEMGMDMETIVSCVNHINQIPGRMERIDKGQDFKVIVDYAHTPDGFEKIFSYAKNLTQNSGGVIGVFGSGGGRDSLKRPLMGEVADKYCKMIFLTEEDPCKEKSEEIAAQIAKGIKTVPYEYCSDRYEAIKRGIGAAESKDTVLILGKGDEDYMESAEGSNAWLGDNKAAEMILSDLMSKVKQ